jgi:hypothetical protein
MLNLASIIQRKAGFLYQAGTLAAVDEKSNKNAPG